jgi:hypothetical protein
MRSCDFNTLLQNANLSISQAVIILSLSKSTIINYKKGNCLPKESTVKFLKLLSGDLSVIDKNYNGWYLKRGELISPENDTFSLNRLNYIQLVFSQLCDMKINKSDLLNKISQLEKENRILKNKKHIKIASNDPVIINNNYMIKKTPSLICNLTNNI